MVCTVFLSSQGHPHRLIFGWPQIGHTTMPFGLITNTRCFCNTWWINWWHNFSFIHQIHLAVFSIWHICYINIFSMLFLLVESVVCAYLIVIKLSVSEGQEKSAPKQSVSSKPELLHQKKIHPSSFTQLDMSCESLFVYIINLNHNRQ